ncbi:DnaJ domain-containing protein [Anaeromyxobacter sp. Fw109-5]|uniref:J domain-containing protein n=1 Tax=Anaeromyxobacter sp. (strain Fw109-5) TaxID=404589 RepID=UPI000158A5D9|nr:DnaJ domain-containing protein [Anaeromyxobacter sp. Fw109-5]ABS24500.1 heat shock protein DnaJ domain protein [Anaeromyxobacter sp. Fw109-5]
MSDGNGQGKAAGAQQPADEAPPRLDRVPPGYRPPPVRAATPPPRVAPEASARAAPPVPPRASYGLAEREVTAAAAIAAGLAREGSLRAEGALHLFLLAAANQAHGRLALASGPVRYALTFRRGTVEHVASAAPEDGLGRFLVRRGALTPEQLVRADGACAPGGDLVATLVAERLLAPSDVAALLGEHGASLVARALAVEDGSWSWEPGAAPPPSGFPLGNPYGMAAAAVRAVDAAGAERRLGDRAGRAASRVVGRVRLEDLRLAPQEARLTGLFDGRSALELAAAHPADAATILRVALLLAEAELLAFGAARASPPRAVPGASASASSAAAAQPTSTPTAPRNPEAGHPSAASGRDAQDRPRVASSAAARAPTSTPTAGARTAAHPERSAAAAAAERARGTPPVPVDPATLRALLQRLAAADHFEVLGVKRDAAPAQVKVAYFRLAKSYHPDAVPASVSAEVRGLCADVFAKVSAAWAVLGDDAQRAKYLDELASGGAADVDVMRILQAENVFQAGTVLVRARRYAEALEKFRDAAVLNEDEPEFAIWLAWCEFLVAKEPRAQHAASAAAIEDGLRRNARCAPGYLFLAQMAKIVGDLSLAERHLRRGLAVAPEHVDLVRELRYLRK